MSTRVKQRVRSVHDIVQVLDALGPIAGSRVLQVDCGAGSSLGAALARGADVWGVDASLDLLRTARLAAPEANLREATATDLPFDNGTFDAVYVLGACRRPDADRRAAEMARVGKIGGVVVMELAGPAAPSTMAPPAVEFDHSVSDRVAIGAGLWPLSSPSGLMISVKICH